ncbi:MAG: protease modulator HflC [Planctomycetota bacterium]
MNDFRMIREMPAEGKGNNMTRIITIVSLVVLVILLSASMYVVDQTEQAVVTQFGKPVRVIVNPIEGRNREQILTELRDKYAKEGIAAAEGAGLRLKIPFIQSVRKFERRLLRWNGYEEQAHGRLDETVNPGMRNSITKRDLIEIVRTDNREMRVAEEELRETTQVSPVTEGRLVIVAEITEAARKACEVYGIGIHSSGVLIKGLIYVQDVKDTVEKRMIEERQRIAKKYTSEGEGEYEKIMGDKEREVKTILSEAYKTAQEIEGEADAKATEIYAKTFGKDPDFYRFWKTLELYEQHLGGEKTRLILGTDNSLLELIKGDMPKTETVPQ